MGRKEEITAKIQSSAIEEFIKKGLSSASMENIAKNADISKRTLYKYYRNKEHIFDDIITLLLNSFSDYSDYSYSKDISIDLQLEQIIQNKIDLIVNDNYLKISKLVLSELLKSKSLSEKHLEQFYLLEQKVVRWIDEAKKDNKIRPNQPSELIANQLYSILKGQIFYPVIFGIKKNIDKQAIEDAKMTAKNFFATFLKGQ